MRNTGTEKPPAQTFTTCKTMPKQLNVLNAKKTSPQVRIKKRKKQNVSRTTWPNNSKERSESYVQEHIILHGTFGEKKVTYASERMLAFCSKIVHSAESVLTWDLELRTMFFLKLLLYYFNHFLQLKAKYLSPNRHVWHSPVTKFALSPKVKQSGQDTTET